MADTIRIVLAGLPEGDWRTYRQPQWMAEVRRRPELAAASKAWFDIDEGAYRACLDEWGAAVGTLELARSRLVAAGARELTL
jgi:hypothetical protein